MAIIGIDLGTTNSLAAVWKDGHAVIIRNSLNKIMTPSVVGTDDEGNVIVGEVARERLITDPAVTVAEFKRDMGTEKKYVFDDAVYTPEEMSAMVLRKIKEDAERYLGEEIEEAVISVPAYFDDLRRTATKKAAALSGLKVERLVNEPSAAAMAYVARNHYQEGTYLVIDFGGGTLDISLIDSFENTLEIVAVAGDNMLGGKDFNEAICNYFMKQNNIDAATLTDKQKATIYSMAESCKIALSTSPFSIMSAVINDKKYELALDSRKLTEITKDLLLRINAPIKRVLKDGNTRVSEITDIILVGGTCKMPIVKAYIENLFRRPMDTLIDPDTAIVQGAAITAAMKAKGEDFKDVIMTDICPFSLGISSSYSDLHVDRTSFIIQRNTPLPASNEHKYYAIRNGQSVFSSSIYQGESIDFTKNIKIGEFSVPLNPVDKGELLGTVRFTYDINGILFVDITTSDGVVHNMVLKNKNVTMSDEEFERIKAKLDKLRLAPIDNEDVTLLIAKAERLIEESLDIEREILIENLLRFKASATAGNNHDIRRNCKKFAEFLSNFDGDLILPGEADQDDDGLPEDFF